MTEMIAKGNVVAFRLRAHGLTERSGNLLDATARCGIQDSPPGSSLLALHARVPNLAQDDLDSAVAEDRTLLRTWSMRGAPFHVPTADASVFTTGVLPPNEPTLRRFVLGVEQSADRLGTSVTDLVELTRAEVPDVLTGRELAINELGAEVAERVATKLPSQQRDVWQEEGPHARGQPTGEAVVHFCIRILTLQGLVCFAPRSGGKAPFVLVDEWLGEPLPDAAPEVARAELVRRYLRCYGPSTRANFAAWLGVRAGDADPWWRLVEDELTPVDVGGRSWILTEDLDALHSAPPAKGVRLLPPRDPYTQASDRETIVDKEHHRQVWRTVGEPGTVLADGAIAGTWRPRKKGRRLTLTVTPFGSLTKRQQEALYDEAEQIAPLRGATSVDVEIDAG